MKCSKSSVVSIAAIVVCSLAIALPALALRKSLGKAQESMRSSTATLEHSLNRRAELTAAVAQKSTELAEREARLLGQLSEIQGRIDNPQSCDLLKPDKPEYGVGILQIASMPVSAGKDNEVFANTQVGRMQTLLRARGLVDWSHRVSQYLGRGKEFVRRVVFNNVSPASAAQMCAWLRCEGWTGGCGLVDDRGAMHIEEHPERHEYLQSDDFIENWRISLRDGLEHGRHPL